MAANVSAAWTRLQSKHTHQPTTNVNIYFTTKNFKTTKKNNQNGDWMMIVLHSDISSAYSNLMGSIVCATTAMRSIEYISNNCINMKVQT
jgi:hypothetical protein